MIDQEFYQVIVKRKEKGRPLCFAHRGVSSLANDGSIEAIAMGIKMKEVDGVEFDVLETCDHQLIVRHNNSLVTQNGNIWIKDLTLKEIRKYQSEQDCPLFPDVLSLFKKTDKIMDIEIKSSGITERIIKLCKEMKVYKNVVFTSLYYDINEEIKTCDRHVARTFGYPRDRGKNLALQKWTQPIVKIVVQFIKLRIKYILPQIMKKADTPFISLYYQIINPNIVDLIHKNKGLCLGAMVNLDNDINAEKSIQIMKKMIDDGVDLIKTDHPQLYPRYAECT